VSGGAIRRKRCGPARFVQWHQRALLDSATKVSGLGVALDHMRVPDRLEVAGDDFVDRCWFRAGDLDDTVSRWRAAQMAAWPVFGPVKVPGPTPVDSATPPIGLTVMYGTVLALAIFRQLEGHPLRYVRRHRSRVPIRPG
jgi:hypothetical protein